MYGNRYVYFGVRWWYFVVVSVWGILIFGIRRGSLNFIFKIVCLFLRLFYDKILRGILGKEEKEVWLEKEWMVCLWIINIFGV